MCHFHFPLNIACLTTFVNEQANNRASVVAGKAKDAVESAAWRFTVFKVGRVQYAATTAVNKACFHYLGLGAVEYQWNAHLRTKPAGNGVHIDGAVAADVVDTDVNNVCAFANLFGAHFGAAVPVACQHEVTKCS